MGPIEARNTAPSPQPVGLATLGRALKALTYDEMMEAAAIFKELLEENKGPIAKLETLAETLNDFLDALDDA